MKKGRNRMASIRQHVSLLLAILTAVAVAPMMMAQADLALTKSGPASVNAGASLSYTLTVTNNGPNAASSITLSDPLPDFTTPVSASGSGWSCTSGSTVTCSMPSLASGAASTVTIDLLA